jgi:probable rRNA maturation factor
MILFLAENISLPAFGHTQVKQWIKAVAKRHDRKTGDISLIFCDDAKILEINQQYLNHDYYTDIITFDYSEGKLISGDIFISVETVATNAGKFNTAFSNELHRVIIHGILHLCGFDDHTPELRKQMTLLENEALELSGMDA